MALMDIKLVEFQAVCGDMDASAGIATIIEKERASATGCATDLALIYVAMSTLRSTLVAILLCTWGLKL